MATVSSPRPRVKSKKPRFVRVLSRLPLCGELLVRIEERGKTTSTFRHYYVSPLPADFGRAFRWEKFGVEGGDVYAVNIGDESTPATCECKGHLAHGHKTVCKHLACTRALIAAGKV